MANKKITELDAVTTLASTDVVPVVDVSADTTNKITAANLFRTLPDGTAAAPALAFSSDAANGVYLAGTDTVGISTGGTQRVTVDGSGNVTISGDLTVSGATTTVESTTVTIDDKNLELGSVATPTDSTADGGGITLKGATDHTIVWTNSTDSWDFSEHVSIASGKEFRIAGTKVLDATSLGSAVVSSSLTSVGTLGSLAVTNNITVGGTVDGRDVATDGTKLDGIETGATADQTKSDIDALGIDAATLDSIDSTSFLRSDAADTKTSGDLSFSDSVKAKFGTGNDLEIYHDGSHSRIVDTGTGVLAIQGPDIRIHSQDANELMAKFVHNGAAELYYDNSKKLETKSDGIDVTGEVQCDSLDVDGVARISSNVGIGTDSVTTQGKLYVVADSGNSNDVKIALSPTNSSGGTNPLAQVAATANGTYGSDLYFTTRTTGGTTAERVRIDSSGHIKHTGLRSGNGENKLANYTVPSHDTSEEDVAVFSVANESSSNEITFGGGGSAYNAATKIKFRTASAVDTTTGTERMQIDSSGRVLIGGTNTYHANADDLVVQGTGQVGVTIASTSTGKSNLFFADSTSNPGTYACYFEYDHSTDALKIGQGNSERIRVDSSGRLLLGTTTEGESGADNLTIADSGNCGMTIRSGSSNAGGIYFSDATSGTGEYDGLMAYSHGDRYLQFYTAATERFRITSTGAWSIEGASNYGTSGQVLTSNGNDSPTWQDVGSIAVGGATAISMNDNVKINFGAGDDLQIFHDGTETYVRNNQGDLILQTISPGDDVILRAHDDVIIQSGGSDNAIICNNDGDVELYYNTSKKLETKSDGVDIIGELQCDSLDVDGAADIAGQLAVNRVVIRDNGSSSPLLAIRADDSSPWAMILGNDSYTTDTGYGLAFYQSTAGDAYQQIRGNGAWENFFLQQANGSTTYTALQVDTNNAVNIRYQGNTKLSTTSSGANVTGELECDTLGVGSSKQNGSVASFKGSNNNQINICDSTNSSWGLLLTQSQGDSTTSSYHYSTNSSVNKPCAIVNVNNDALHFATNNAARFRIDHNGHALPAANNSYDLGSSSYRWRNVYTNDLNLSNEGSTNDVDGTWGNYTIQEGEDDLFLINRRNGKKYKFNLTEVS